MNRLTLSTVLVAVLLSSPAHAQQRTIYGPDGRPNGHVTTDTQGTHTIYGPDGRALSRWSKDTQGNTVIYGPDGRRMGTIGQPKDKK